MADIINLRTARKQRQRVEKEKRAADNRLLHGMPAEEKKRLKSEKQQQEQKIEAHRLERGKPEEDRG